MTVAHHTDDDEDGRVPDRDQRRRFRELHRRDAVFVMPNPWDVGSARMLASLGFEALATTSAGHAWSIGKHNQQGSRDEMVEHVRLMATATPLPLSVDSERCFPGDSGGVAETVGRLADAGAAGCSIEDFDPATRSIEPLAVAAERVAVAAAAAHAPPDPMVLTARAENHFYDKGDLDDTIARLIAFRDAGADVVYAPGLTDLGDFARLVRAVGVPVNALAIPGGPTVAELGSVGVRRVSIGGSLARVAYGAMLDGAREILQHGTSGYVAGGATRSDLQRAFGER